MRPENYSDAKLQETTGLLVPCVRRFLGDEPVLITEAKGAVLKDAKGKEYFDLLASHGCATLIGYSHPAVVEAIREQAGKIHHITVELATNPVIELAEELIDVTPESLQKVYFANAGTEAVEMSLYLAKKATGRAEMVSLYGDFHGRSHGSRSLLGFSPLKKGMGPHLPGVTRIPHYNCYRCQLGHEYPSCGLQCAKILEDALYYDTSGDVAVFVTESLQGTAGNIPMPDGYLKEIRRICDNHGILLFVDEIFTAFGTTGKLFCHEHDGVIPDIMTMSKTLGSGLPISAMLTTEEIASAFAAPEPPMYFTTFGSNPIMAAGALACVKTMMEEKPWEKAARKGELWMAGFKKLQDKYEIIGDVRGRGVMIGVELVKDRQTKEPARDESLALKAEAGKRGVILPAGQGWLGNTIRMVPPVVMSDDQIEQVLDILDGCFAAIQ